MPAPRAIAAAGPPAAAATGVPTPQKVELSVGVTGSPEDAIGGIEGMGLFVVRASFFVLGY